MSKIDEIIEMLQSLDNEYRLEMLLDYSEKLPPLPEKYQNAAEKESHRVHECMTPVSLWVEIVDGKVHVFADVPRESPTVRGFISMLLDAFNGESPEVVLTAPTDILQRSGLANALGMRRIQGLGVMLQRIKGEVSRKVKSEK